MRKSEKGKNEEKKLCTFAILCAAAECPNVVCAWRFSLHIDKKEQALLVCTIVGSTAVVLY